MNESTSTASATSTDVRVLTYWDRSAGALQEEKVPCRGTLEFLYRNPVGRLLRRLFMTQRLINRVGGLYFSSPFSLDRIKSFVKDQKLELGEFEEKSYLSFNDFFVRRFKPGFRPFEADPRRMPALAEGRYLAFDRISPGQTFPVKGHDLTARALLGDSQQCEAFIGGPVLVARLAPVDYHRFHYPDSGRTVAVTDLDGGLNSVNPIALAQKSDILATNHRKVCYLTTNNFGRLAVVQVGAMGVGRIVHSQEQAANFNRGDEMGYFCYGGSTVVLFGEPGYWQPDDDLISRSGEGIETLVRLGDAVATSTRRQAETGKDVALAGGRHMRVKRG